MKKLLIAIAASVIVGGVALTNTGCKTVPDTKTVEAISVSIGGASAVVCKMSITNEQTLATVCDIMEIVDGIVPATNSNCVTAWYPVITNVVTIAYNEGKFNEDEAAIIIDIGMAAAHGVDWMFKTHPKWKVYSDVAVVAEKGFVYGFTYVIQKKMYLSATTESSTYDIIDYDAYEYFRATYKIGK